MSMNTVQPPPAERKTPSRMTCDTLEAVARSVLARAPGPEQDREALALIRLASAYWEVGPELYRSAVEAAEDVLAVAQKFRATLEPVDVSDEAIEQALRGGDFELVHAIMRRSREELSALRDEPNDEATWEIEMDIRERMARIERAIAARVHRLHGYHGPNRSPVRRAARRAPRRARVARTVARVARAGPDAPSEPPSEDDPGRTHASWGAP